MRFKAYTISTAKEIELGCDIVLYPCRSDLYELYGLNIKVNYICIDREVDLIDSIMSFEDIGEN
jgi:hypothetical protein